MPATSYKVFSWGARVMTAAGHPAGVTGAVNVALCAVAKKATTTEPYIVANELVCNAFARLLLLPCPPGATLHNGGEPHFCSLDFNLAGHPLPPIDPAAFVGVFPDLSWGIIVFDTFVMNSDRHRGNVAHDKTSGRPQIFDHSHAFLSPAGDVSARLVNGANKLCIGGHCLAQEINVPYGLPQWIERIRQIPDYFIEGVIEAATLVGLPPAHKNECIDFMKDRRSNIETIVLANKSEFKRVTI